MSTFDDATVRLERRYRRLLAWFPADFRARYTEEMLAVVMSSSQPGQRRPDPGEAGSLVFSGLRMRLLAPMRGMRAPVWRASAAAFATLSSILIVAVLAEPLAVTIGWSHRVGVPVYLSRTAIAAAAGWTVVALARVMGWRRVAAVGASIGLVAGVVSLGFSLYAVSADVLCWSASIVVAAWIDVVARPSSSVSGLSRRAIGLVVSAAALFVVAPVVEIQLTRITLYSGGAVGLGPAPGGLFLPAPVAWLGTGAISVLGRVVAVALLAFVIVRLMPPVRRRVLLMLAGVGAAVVLRGTRFGGVTTDQELGSAAFLSVFQWMALVLVPAVVLAAGLAMIRRYEDRGRRLGGGVETGP